MSAHGISDATLDKGCGLASDLTKPERALLQRLSNNATEGLEPLQPVNKVGIAPCRLSNQKQKKPRCLQRGFCLGKPTPVGQAPVRTVTVVLPTVVLPTTTAPAALTVTGIVTACDTTPPKLIVTPALAAVPDTCNPAV